MNGGRPDLIGNQGAASRQGSGRGHFYSAQPRSLEHVPQSRIAGVTNEAALIKMGQGKKAMSDAMAKDIEEKLRLPTGWMDRDNEGLIKMESLEYALCKQILLVNEKAKKGLLSFVSSMRS